MGGRDGERLFLTGGENRDFREIFTKHIPADLDLLVKSMQVGERVLLEPMEGRGPGETGARKTVRVPEAETLDALRDKFMPADCCAEGTLLCRLIGAAKGQIAHPEPLILELISAKQEVKDFQCFGHNVTQQVNFLGISLGCFGIKPG